jgi:short-subunit dehydrogenase|tara:strand:+ start:467 stop:1240 length:774 start_codon:yes stop_codon:yes gene_type:complete
MLKNLSMNSQNKIILITGATSGIGLSLSKLYLKNGWVVIGLGRNIESLQNLQKKYLERLIIAKCDLAKKENIKETFKTILKKFPNLHSFIFNAGVYKTDDFDTFTEESIEETINVNLLSVYRCLLEIRNRLKEPNQSLLAIVSSVAGYRGLPKSISYGPTKAALINLAESLKIETEKYLVDIKLICPGFVDTPATKINKFKMPFLISSEKAADIIVKKISKNGFEISFPFPFSFIMKFARIIPYWIYFRKASKLINK